MSSAPGKRGRADEACERINVSPAELMGWLASSPVGKQQSGGDSTQGQSNSTGTERWGDGMPGDQSELDFIENLFAGTEALTAVAPAAVPPASSATGEDEALSALPPSDSTAEEDQQVHSRLLSQARLQGPTVVTAWSRSPSGRVRLHIVFPDRPGLLSVLSNTLLQHGGSVCSVSAQTTEDGYAVDLIGVEDLPEDLRAVDEHLRAALAPAPGRSRATSDDASSSSLDTMEASAARPLYAA